MSEEKKSGCFKIFVIVGVCLLGLIIVGWFFFSKKIDEGKNIIKYGIRQEGYGTG